MRIGVPKEIKSAELRVGLTPTSVRELARDGHQIFVETGAGMGVDSSDEAYRAAGAEIATNAAEIFECAELIVKVKEPQAAERAFLQPHHTLFTYLHLAPDAEQTKDLVASGATCIAYETVTDGAGGLPLLTPMSQVAGRMSIQAGATSLESTRGGAGLLLGGVPGVAPAKVVVLGGGVVGMNAIQMALGLGADVTVLDRDTGVLESLCSRFGAGLRTVFSTSDAIETLVLDADLVIGAVLVRGAAAPHLVTARHIKQMRRGSAVVDVAIDQGGCFETSRPTTHERPTYLVDEVVHYCVANIPGAVPKTSTYALNHATLPFVQQLANRGIHAALSTNPNLRDGLNVTNGVVTEPAVALALGYDYTDPILALESH
ncbi:MAG: alanine dehydrogenase [bacterium]|nr:alanine dehydrogenase [Deltaproteobacteria bacterium]MCP4904272.1 alanine dehydrogenase [bacterium]